MTEVTHIAANAAKDIEQAETARDAQLIGDTVTDVSFTFGINGTLKEITVQYNSRNATIRVDLYAEALTASAGFDSHRVPLFDRDESNTEAVLEGAKSFWKSQARAIKFEV